MKTICIDAGHYGTYNAGVIKGYYEAQAVWALQDHLVNELKAYDVKIVCTRADPKKDLSLTNRAMVAVKNKADLFVSLHSNAAGSSLSTADRKVRGVVVFYSVMQKALKPEADALADVVAKAMGTKVDRVATWPSQTRKGRDYLTVMDVSVYNGVPRMFLIEHGFHTNKEDCALMMDDAVRKKIAKAEAAYFAKLLGLKKKEDPKPTPTPKNAKVEAWQKAAVKDGFVLTVTGQWDTKTKAVAKKAIVKKRDEYLYPNLTKIVQRAVGVTADGKCGSKTDAAIRAYQKKAGLTADGCVGINTWTVILGV